MSGVDGRTARREANRQAVITAMVELFAEDVDPSPDAVAERSGVSPRSVYRYFEDRDALIRAAIDHQLASVAPLFVVANLGEGPLHERAQNLVAARVRLYGAVANTARVARVRAARHEAVASQLATGRAAMRDQVIRQFQPELAALDTERSTRVLDAVDALTQLETLDYLSLGRGLSPEELADVLVLSIEQLLRENN